MLRTSLLLLCDVLLVLLLFRSLLRGYRLRFDNRVPCGDELIFYSSLLHNVRNCIYTCAAAALACCCAAVAAADAACCGCFHRFWDGTISCCCPLHLIPDFFFVYSNTIYF